MKDQIKYQHHSFKSLEDLSLHQGSELGYFYQLSKRAISGSATLVCDDLIKIINITCCCNLLEFGSTNQDTIALFFNSSGRHFFINGINVPHGFMAGISESSDYIAHHPSAYSSVIVHINILRLKKLYSETMALNIQRLVSESGITPIHSPYIQKSLLSMIDSLNEYYESGDTTITHPLCKRLSKFLLSTLADLPIGEYMRLQSKPNRRSDIVFKSLKLIVEDPTNILKAKNLSDYFGISLRTLEMSFKHVLGRTPTESIRCIRLNLMRTDLVANKSHLSVTQSALKYGFTHTGNCSKYYHELFGEKPITTMKNNKHITSKLNQNLNNPTE